MTQFIYTFGLGEAVTETSSEILGGKGAGLMWMSQNGITVPPGFVISTKVWEMYDKAPEKTMEAIGNSIEPYLSKLESKFGYMPLLSVRSGARVSCPGMMDTILNVGLDETTELGWMNRLGMDCFTNSRHRLITMYGSVVDGIERQLLEKGTVTDAEAMYKRKTGKEFPKFHEQLLGSIEAVFKSWNNERAIVYRKLNNIPAEWGTAVTVQAMVFGNLNDNSGTGVLFTRNVDTGENAVTGEFLVNAQGEDVVAGIRTPMKMAKMPEWNKAVADELMDTVLKLEKLKGDVQDVEFTIQDGQLYLLQTRNAKRTALAAVKIALDMVKEDLISPELAVTRVTARQLDTAKRPMIAKGFKVEPKWVGISACSGVVSGKPVFSSKEAVNAKVPVILITEETTPDDIAGMHAAKGVITMTGGLTSHAAVVARGMDKPCIVGLGKTLADFKGETIVSIDGATGAIWLEPVPVIGGENNPLVWEFSQLLAKVHGITPVISAVPPQKMERAYFFVGEEVLDPVALNKKVLAILTKVEQLYLDFSPAGTEAYAKYMVNFEAAEKGCQQKAVAMLEEQLSPAQVVLVGATSSKFTTVGTVTDLESMVMAKGFIAVEGTGTKLPPAIKKVMKWQQQEGVQFLSIGFKGEGESFMSPEQALQLIAK